MNKSGKKRKKVEKRFTKAEISQLEVQILDYVKITNPVSIRHVFYRMTDPNLPVHVEKTEGGYNKIQFRMKEMRLNGRMPYAWIADMTRRGYFTSTWSSKNDFLTDVTRLYRRSVWKDHCYDYLEVWVESRSIVGVIQDLCTELAVPLYPCGGFASLSLEYEAAEAIKAEIVAYGYNNVVIIYIGDYDPSGLEIDRDLEGKMRHFLGDDIGIEFRRIAITDEQIGQYDLPVKPRKKTDNRRLDITRTVETEALDASILRGLLRTEVERYIPDGVLDVLRTTERSERNDLLTLTG